MQGSVLVEMKHKADAEKILAMTPPPAYQGTPLTVMTAAAWQEEDKKKKKERKPKAAEAAEEKEEKRGPLVFASVD